MFNKKTGLFIFFILFLLNVQAQSPWTLAYQHPMGSLNGIFAISPGQVVATADWGRIYQSDDGAQNMALYQLPGNLSTLSDVAFRNPQQGIVGGGCYFPTGDCLENILARTDDGGQSWIVTQLSHELGVINFVNYTPDGAAYAMSDYGGYFRFNPQTMLWDSLGRPANTSSGVYTNMQFMDQNNGFVEHWTYNNGQNVNRLFGSNDGGQQWELLFTANGGSAATYHHFTSPQKGFQWSSTGQLGISTDGGHNWTTEQVFPVTEQINKVDFQNQDIGYLSTWNQDMKVGRIYRTNDGGNTWAMDFEVPDVRFNDFNLSDPDNGYAIGNHNLIYRRTGSTPTNEPLLEKIISISPNPASDLVRVILPRQRNFETLALFDMIGRKLQRFDLLEDQFELSFNTSVYPAGLYFVAPLDGHGTAVKLILERQY